MEDAFTEPLFDSAGPALWARITARLSQHFGDLHRRGALRGATPQDAFYVQCDAETNPPEVRDAGRVVAEVGLAPAVPREFVVVQIVRDTGGVAITVPRASEKES
jgi:phage tail sheath protein FI